MINLCDMFYLKFKIPLVNTRFGQDLSEGPTLPVFFSFFNSHCITLL